MLINVDSSMIIWILSGIAIFGYFMFTLAFKDISKANIKESIIKAFYGVCLFLFFVLPFFKLDSMSLSEIKYFGSLRAYYIISFIVYFKYKNLIFGKKSMIKRFWFEKRFNPTSRKKYVYLILSTGLMAVFGIYAWRVIPLTQNVIGEFSLSWSMKIITAFILSITGSGNLFTVGLLLSSTEEKFVINGSETVGYKVGENEKSIFVWTKESEVFELSKDNVKQKATIEKTM